MLWVTIFTWTFFFFLCSCNRHNIAGYWFLQQELNCLTSVQMKCRSYFVGAAWVSLCICLYAFVVLVPENCHCLHSLVLCPLASMLTMNNTTNQSKWKDLIAIIRATFGCLGLWAVTVHHSCWTEGSVQAFKLAKLVLLCWDAGPAFDPWGIATFSRFLPVMNLSLHLKPNLSRARAWELKELKDPSVLLQKIHGEIHGKHKLINNSSIRRKIMKSRGE